MKKFIICSLPLIALIVSGCAMRLIPTKVDRVDQEIKGNRGIISGTPSYIPNRETKKKDTRTIYNLEVELLSPMDMEVKKTKSEDVDLYGNKGYINKTALPGKKGGVTTLKSISVTDTPQVIYQKPKKRGSDIATKTEEKQKIYTVEKGDTLQKISSKMYGTTKRWKKIYEANKSVLKSPDTIKPGQKLVIPID